MAIKGKGKTKSRPPARAPRPAPVVRKPPFFARRWVQVVAALVSFASAASLARNPFVAHTTVVTMPIPTRSAPTTCTQRRAKKGGVRTTGVGRGARAGGLLFVLPFPLIAMGIYLFRRRMTMIAAS